MTPDTHADTDTGADTSAAQARPAAGTTAGVPGQQVAGRSRRRDYPSWPMVWALAVTETVSYAALFYCFAVMVVPMRADLGASTAQLSLALTIGMAVNGAAAVPVGRWVDRHGARWVMTGGSVLGAASVVAWSRAASLPQRSAGR